MKRFLFAVALAAAAAPVLAADFDISVNIGQPGFYGRIDVGDYPPPRLIYQQPRFIERVPSSRQPIYLHVPPGHAKNWRKHCGKYNACGERVYFVQNSWYDREYVPRYRERHHERRDGRHDDRRDGRRDDHRGDHRDKHRGNDRGNDRHDNDRDRDHGKKH